MAKDSAPQMEDLGYTYDDLEGEPVPAKDSAKTIHYPSVRIEDVPNLEEAKVDDMVKVTFLARVRGIDSHSYGESSKRPTKIHYDLELQEGCGEIVSSAKDKKNTATADDVTAMKKSKDKNYMDTLTQADS